MGYDWNQQGDLSCAPVVYLGDAQRKIKKTISDYVETRGARKYEVSGRYEVHPETGRSDHSGHMETLTEFAQSVANRTTPEGIYGMHITAPDRVGRDACWFAVEGFAILVKQQGGE
jgi:hypothetical protein